ncbi:hypothetical protein EC988_007392, partial [Linderina pennispora]
LYAPMDAPEPSPMASVFAPTPELRDESQRSMRPRSNTAASVSAAPPGFVEAVWQKSDVQYVDQLRRMGRVHVIQRREQYWATAIALFPNLQVLDGSKIPPR